VFRALPPSGAPRLVHDAVPVGASILDLGCGAGRLSEPLARLGHGVTAVDVSPEMLACIGQAGIETVEADIAGLDLGRTFGAVVLASYLVNHPDPVTAARFLATCRRHVESGGVVLVQRYDPRWAVEAVPDRAPMGDVVVSVGDFVVSAAKDRFAATVTYAIGGRTWRQRIDARIVGDDDLDRAATEVDLIVVGWLDEHRTWGRLRPR